MPISSYVIRCHPADRRRVQEALRRLPDVEVGVVTADGIAVATDTPTSHAAEDLGRSLETLPGVRSAVLVYHNFEDVIDVHPAASPAGLNADHAPVECTLPSPPPHP